MNKNVLLSLFAFCLYALIAGGSADFLGVWIISVGIASAIVLVIALIRQKISVKHAKKKQDYRNQLIQDANAKYGTGYDVHGVLIYPDAKVIFVGTSESEYEEIKFEDIKSINILCFLNKTHSEIAGKTAVTEISTDTGNAIKRGVVGGLVAGSAGAIVGAATAKRKVTTKYNYTYKQVSDHNNCSVQINGKDVLVFQGELLPMSFAMRIISSIQTYVKIRKGNMEFVR